MIRRTSGFTIIEVVLFLAISGLMAIGLLAGTSMAIQRQQYRDAVQSFAGYLRDEYARVVSVENDGTAKCGASVRGQSECFIVGRLIKTTGAAGRSYVSYPVYSNESGVYQYDESQALSYDVAWSAKTKMQDAGDNALALLMYRDRDTGRLEIRSKQGDVTNAAVGGNSISALMSSTDAAEGREICVYDDGWLKGERQSVFLTAKAGSGDAIAINNATAGCNNA